uniref:Angiotensinogen n=1 Tax=Leptobrachium leishanense TaxID=445787 RepID=A0A8C5QD64_9ANUR
MKLHTILLLLAPCVSMSVCNRVYVHPFHLFNFNKTECEKTESQNQTVETFFTPISIQSKLMPEKEHVKEPTSLDIKQLGVAEKFVLNRLSSLVEDFGRRTLNVMSKIGKHNTFLLSYTNLYRTLMSFYLGASGNTSDSLQALLGFGYPSGNENCISKLNGDKVILALRNIEDLVISTDGNIIDRTIAYIFVSADIPLLESFIQHLLPSADELYVRSVDFTDSLKATDSINDFLQSQSSRKSRNVLNAIASSTNFLYVSHVHFTGKVKNYFPTTEPQEFWIEPNIKMLVPMMSVKGDFQYKMDNTKEISVLRMPISENDFLLLVQPTNGNTLDNIESSISRDTVTNWMANLSSRKMKITLPKLDIESSYNVQDILANIMGIQTLFGKNADFSKISKADIHVGEIINRVHFVLEDIASDRNEDNALDKDDLECLNVTYNKPFLMALFEGVSKALIFFGRITNPVTVH